MAKMATALFPELLNKKHREIFEDTYKNWQPIYEKVFKVMDTDQKTTTFSGISGLGLWTAGTEGQPIATQDLVDTPNRSFTAVRYENSYTITHEMMKDDVYKTRLLGGFGMNGSASGMAKGAREKEERIAAGVLSGGFANVGYDGVALFSAAHPLHNTVAEVDDNLATGALTDGNLELGIIKFMSQRDESGLQIYTMPKVLMVNTSNIYNAERILNSSLRSGTSNNDTNALPKLQIVVNPYLTTQKEWFLIDTDYENLVFLWRERPQFEIQKIQGTIDMQAIGFSRFSAGYVNYRGLVGSTGL